MTPTRVPAAPLLLGVGGLVPFLAGACVLRFGLDIAFVGGPDRVRVSLIVYAVAILSFLGGVRWGVALGEVRTAVATRQFAIAVLPALIGWGATWLSPRPALWTLTGAFVILGWMDFGWARQLAQARWYGRLRVGLTLVVSLSLAVSALS